MRLDRLPPAQAQRLAELECPNFATEPWVTGRPLSQRRVAIVSSAGLLVRGGMPFRGRDPDYHVIPPGANPGDLLVAGSFLVPNSYVPRNARPATLTPT